MKKVLGILGGMGSEATVDLFGKIVHLTPVKKDQDHIHMIINNYPAIPDRTGAILRGEEDPTPYLLDGAKVLEKAGVDAILMSCNTAHYFLPRFADKVSVPFISIIDSAINELRDTYPNAKNIIPISTTGTKASRVYEDALIKAGYNVIDLPDDIMKDVMYAIYDGVKKGKTAEVAEHFQNTLNAIGELKPDVLIAACTEIPLLLEHTKAPVPVVDATYAMAKAGVKFALGD